MPRNSDFQTVHTEGGLLPADQLSRIAIGKADGIAPTDYGLPPGEKVNEAISQCWARLCKHWADFQQSRASLPDDQPGTDITNQKWLLPLFASLGYGRLTTSKAPEIDGKTYPITRYHGHLPIHFVGCNIALDKRSPGVKGAATGTPHGLVQEFLNRTEDHLWAFVSNGRQLRILRDNVALSRQSYIEFDLEGMFDGEVYSDFALLWMVCHVTRTEGERPELCWLEKWSAAAREHGTRVLENLRIGVEHAIEALGRGFISHPANDTLRQKLRDGQLDRQALYHQVLRTVYRLLFLFVAEDRDLLHTPDTTDEARELYDEHYSTRRLRDLAGQIKGSRHGDLWHVLSLTFAAVSGEESAEAIRTHLGLPALGSRLWRIDETPNILGPSPACPELPERVQLSNDDLLDAIRYLAYVQQEHTLQSVNYRDLGSEELGSVYESLLELQPDIHPEARKFELRTVTGSERKTTGSYYTPDSLVQCLLDSALEPVIKDRLEDARRLANGEWKSDKERSHALSIVSGPGGLAAGNERRGKPVSPDEGLPERRAVRDGQPDTPGGLFDTGEYRRGMGTPEQQGVPAIPADRPGQPAGAGNPPAPLPEGSTGNRGSNHADPGRTDNPQQTTPGPAAQSQGEDPLTKRWRAIPLATRHSLLAEKALLSLTVCDPACGSGHFLIGAAHRLARHLSRLRAIAAGESEPTPEVYQHALRDVIAHCIYGVDINPMAVELCKVSLWLEALDPGRPLAFLDHHIQCGNSLLGTTPALIAKGIPDDAFKPIEGDDKEACKQLKAENKSERKGQRRLWGAMPSIHLGNMAQTFANIDAEDDSTPEALAAKEKHYQEFVSSAAYENARFLADAWCAAFVWPKTDPRDPAVTTETIRRIEDNPHEYPNGSPIREGVRKLANQYQFFHWHLVFPDIFRLPAKDEPPENEQTGWSGGFDCVLGNPPWERIEVETVEFFAVHRPEIATASNARTRDVLIAELREDDPAIHSLWRLHVRQVTATAALLRGSGSVPLTARGNFNTYALMAEVASMVVAPTGRLGMVVPTGLATDKDTSGFFSSLVISSRLRSFYDFTNRGGLFANVHRQYRFALLTASGAGVTGDVGLSALLEHPTDLHDRTRTYSLSSEALRRVNPNTGAYPTFQNSLDAALIGLIHLRHPVLLNETSPEENTWTIDPCRMFHMGDDSGLFETTKGREVAVPEGRARLFEAKMVWQYDHRFATFAGVPEADLDRGLPREAEPREKGATGIAWPRYTVSRDDLNRMMCSPRRSPIGEWFLSYRDITNATNERTLAAAITPFEGHGDTIQQIYTPGHDWDEVACLLANLNSLALDFVARRKISGSHVKHHHLKQLPAIATGSYGDDSSSGDPRSRHWFASRVLALTYTSHDLEAFARSCGYDGPPFVWDEERRFLIRCELDAAFFHLYLGTESEWRESGSKELLEYFPAPRHAVEYIMETFPIVKRKDEQAHGHYRTKDTILEIYDEMAEAIAANEAARAAGQPATAQYQTRLDPPPGPPTDEAGNFIPYADWTPEIHARYANIIHPPRTEPKTEQELEVLQTGQAVLDTLTFLYACDVKRVDRLFLEVGLLLMRNDALRKRVASEGIPTVAGSAAARPRINHMDQFLQEIGPGGGDQIAIDASSGIQMIGIGTEAPSLDDILARNVGKQAWDRAQEAVIAAKRIQEHCNSVEECLDALGVANASAFSIG